MVPQDKELPVQVYMKVSSNLAYTLGPIAKTSWLCRG